jgi:sugar-specific transcriptional regulator TrmB
MEPAEPALDGFLGRAAQDLREFASRITDQRHAEQLEFRQRMSAVQEARAMRQKEKEDLEMQIQRHQQRLQELNREGVASDREMEQLEIGYNAAAEKWEKAREEFKDQISTAISSTVRLSIHSTLYHGL